MRNRFPLFGIFSFVLLAIASACGSNANDEGFGDGTDGGPSSSSGGDSSFQTGDGPTFHGDSGGFNTGDTGKTTQCTGLECKITNCAAQGKPETALSGTIRDPAGNLPLYNVYVYIPNTTPDAIVPGSPTCTACEAPASGNPILGTSTDTSGKFRLTKTAVDGGTSWGVPDGASIPLVIQVGKWRRQVVIPQVDACTTVDLDSVLGPDLMRLPKKSSEGDMPLIALTTAGYDAFECFLRVVGVDDSEFVPPTSTTGHVHVYTGAYDDPSSPAASIAGGNSVSNTFQWWNSSANLLKYDFVLNGCDGVEPGSRGTGYTAIEQFLDAGGRVFGTDFFVDWFSPPDAPAIDSTVASWPGWGNGQSYGSYFIDTSFPKGQAFGQWLLANGIAKTSGTGIGINLTDTYPSVDGAGPPTYPGSTRWIYNAQKAGASASSASYISFNTPVGKPTAQQCGRAVFSGVHVYLPSGTGTFPKECGTEGGPTSPYGINQHALEFLFFDLSSCVQDDTQPPPPPPGAQ